MAQPYVGEIRLFAGNFAPMGWEFCEGQLLHTSECETLFNLIGTSYGGDGQSSFALPDLRGRVPVHEGSGIRVGDRGGVEEVSLAASQIPSHNHALLASARSATASSPVNRVLGESTAVQLYVEDAPTVAMQVASLQATGGSQPHTNLQPYLCINYIISLFGIFPNQA